MSLKFIRVFITLPYLLMIVYFTVYCQYKVPVLAVKRLPA
jgi:hypothetical protein